MSSKEPTYTLIGFKVDEFKNKAGEIIKYAKLFVTYDAELNTVQGMACEAVSVSPELTDSLHVGDCISFSYNKFGRVQDVNIVD